MITPSMFDLNIVCRIIVAVERYTRYSLLHYCALHADPDRVRAIKDLNASNYRALHADPDRVGAIKDKKASNKRNFRQTC